MSWDVPQLAENFKQTWKQYETILTAKRSFALSVPNHVQLISRNMKGKKKNLQRDVSMSPGTHCGIPRFPKQKLLPRNLPSPCSTEVWASCRGTTMEPCPWHPLTSPYMSSTQYWLNSPFVTKMVLHPATSLRSYWNSSGSGPLREDLFVGRPKREDRLCLSENWGPTWNSNFHHCGETMTIYTQYMSNIGSYRFTLINDCVEYWQYIHWRIHHNMSYNDYIIKINFVNCWWMLAMPKCGNIPSTVFLSQIHHRKSGRHLALPRSRIRI